MYCSRSLPSGLNAVASDWRVEPLQPCSDPRARVEGHPERAAGVDRVVESAGLERQEKRKVEVFRHDLTRLRREASRRSDGCRVARGCAGTSATAPATSASASRTTTPASMIRRRRARRRASLQLALLRSAASLKEGSFVCSEAGATIGPVERGHEPHTAVQLARVASHRLPCLGRPGARCRCTSRPSRSSFSHPRSLGH